MTFPNLKQIIKFCANISVGGMLLTSIQVQALSEQSAGEVTFLIGKAFINGDTPVAIGSKISSGDSIQTLSNSHVHVRFVDNGLISVRPDSRLAIEHYDYNASEPEKSTIKFNLENGVMRSISGTGAKSARDKFRLNTPIAAIGVRGTDFVVKTNDELLQAVVNEGAIIVAPFSDECTIASTGPCQAHNVELSSLSDQLLEFATLYDAPRLIPLSRAIRSSLLDQVDTTTSSTEDGSSSVLEQTSNNSEHKHKLYEENSAYDSLASAESASSTNTPRIPESIEASKLAWGRFSNSASPNDLKSIVSFDEARVNSAVGVSADSISSGLLMSFRSGPADEVINAQLGNVQFDLSAAQASLTTASGVSHSMKFNSGDLQIDFASRNFSTQLNMYNPITSDVQFQANGQLSRFGFFKSSTADSAISLLTTINGEESSYYFMKQVEAGAIEGITFWHD